MADSFEALLDEFRAFSGRVSTAAEGNTTEPQQAAASAVILPPEHTCDAGQSLPELASELAVVHGTQDVEMEQRQQLLAMTKEKLSKEKRYLLSLEKDVSSTNKSICLAQDFVTQTEQQCESTEREIQAMVSEEQRLKAELKQRREEEERLRKQREQYREKMSRHSALTEEAEQSSCVMKEKAELVTRISSLRMRRDGYMQGDGLQVLSGERQRTLQEQISAVEADSSMALSEQKELRNIIHSRMEHKQQLKREVDMSKKRHNAQLTRLHRQLQEAQVRRRQWGEEATRLRVAITQLRQKMGE